MKNTAWHFTLHLSKILEDSSLSLLLVGGEGGEGMLLRGVSRHFRDFLNGLNVNGTNTETKGSVRQLKTKVRFRGTFRGMFRGTFLHSCRKYPHRTWHTQILLGCETQNKTYAFNYNTLEPIHLCMAHKRILTHTASFQRKLYGLGKQAVLQHVRLGAKECAVISNVPYGSSLLL